MNCAGSFGDLEGSAHKAIGRRIRSWPIRTAPRGPSGDKWFVLVMLIVAAALAFSLRSQSPPFSTSINIATTPRLGFIAGTQGGDGTLVMTPCCWCEQDVYAWTMPGTAVAVPVPAFGWHPTIGNQVVLATEGYRCQPFPPFQGMFPVGSYVPLFGVSARNSGTRVPISGSALQWRTLHLDLATATFFVPPFRVIDANTMPYERFLATIDVPLDPALRGAELWIQAFRDDPHVGLVHASRAVAMVLY